MAPTGICGQLDIEPPIVGRPDEFSNLVGSYVISAAAKPAVAFEGDPIRLAVRITGSGPKKYQPKRQFLKIIPAEMKEIFHVEPLPQEDRHLAETNTWEFVYQLRSKTSDATEIPPMVLWHYSDSLERYQPSFCDAIPIQIKRRIRVIEAPDRMYDITKGLTVLQNSRSDSVPWLWLMIGAIAVLGGNLVWYRLWLALFPDFSRRTRRQSNKAARRATSALRNLDRQTDPECIADILNRYYRDRFGIKIREPTPPEIHDKFERSGISCELVRRAAMLTQECQECRFAPVNGIPNSDLRKKAIKLIEAIENEK